MWFSEYHVKECALLHSGAVSLQPGIDALILWLLLLLAAAVVVGSVVAARRRRTRLGRAW